MSQIPNFFALFARPGDAVGDSEVDGRQEINMKAAALAAPTLLVSSSLHVSDWPALLSSSGCCPLAAAVSDVP